jgi:hypothetical protein
MGYAIALILSLALTGWAAQDAARRGRSWYGWSRLVFFAGIFGLIAWLVVRRRAPVTVERLGVLRTSLQGFDKNHSRRYQPERRGVS